MANTNGNNYCSSENLRAVKELIIDEHKLVTYVSASKDLCLHVNEAKILLGQVVDEIKRNNLSIRLNVCFLISGLFANNSGRTIVCSESDLETQRNAFKTVFFQHIYSVSQGSSCVDNAAFVSAYKFEDFPLCAGLIKGNLCTKRSSDEIGTLKSNSQKTVDVQLPAVVPPKNETKEKKNTVENGHIDNNNKVMKVHDSKSEPVIKSEVISPKKEISSNSTAKFSAKNGIKHSNGIAGFFTKSNSDPNTKPTKVDKKNVSGTINKAETQHIQKQETELEVKKETLTKVKKEIQPKIEKVTQDEHMDVDEDILAKDIKKEPDSTKKSKHKKNGSLSQIKKTAKVDKKRKRVLHVSDSESDDNDPFADVQPSNHESDDEIPPTPSTNTVKITSGILNPKKRRKIVDKTYTDEEGYILTRKEEVFESCSEEEVETKADCAKIQPQKENMEQSNKVKTEVSPKEKKPKNSKKKVSPPQKGKQANIMTFFKKI